MIFAEQGDLRRLSDRCINLHLFFSDVILHLRPQGACRCWRIIFRRRCAVDRPIHPIPVQFPSPLYTTTTLTTLSVLYLNAVKVPFFADFNAPETYALARA